MTTLMKKISLTEALGFGKQAKQEKGGLPVGDTFNAGISEVGKTMSIIEGGMDLV